MLAAGPHNVAAADAVTQRSPINAPIAMPTAASQMSVGINRRQSVRIDDSRVDRQLYRSKWCLSRAVQYVAGVCIEPAAVARARNDTAAHRADGAALMRAGCGEAVDRATCVARDDDMRPAQDDPAAYRNFRERDQPLSE